MTAEFLTTTADAARRAANILAMEATAAVAARGRFVMAVSGGSTPWSMLRAFAASVIPWPNVHIVQVDERVTPDGHPDRNLTNLRASLLHRPAKIHAMPVNSPDLQKAAAEYAAVLEQLIGTPTMLDVVHLGLGRDGHTASLVPGDAALGVADRDVTITAPYQGTRRMTLTYPIINRARRILWVVTGEEKAPILARLLDGDELIPAGRIRRERALLIADHAAASKQYSKGSTRCA